MMSNDGLSDSRTLKVIHMRPIREAHETPTYVTYHGTTLTSQDLKHYLLEPVLPDGWSGTKAVGCLDAALVSDSNIRRSPLILIRSACWRRLRGTTKQSHCTRRRQHRGRKTFCPCSSAKSLTEVSYRNKSPNSFTRSSSRNLTTV